MPALDFKVLPNHTLFDLARNDSAPYATRIAATEELIDRDDKKAFHADLRQFFDEVMRRRDNAKELAENGGIPVNGQGYLGPTPEEWDAKMAAEEDMADSVPMNASVTTKTLFQDDFIDNAAESE